MNRVEDSTKVFKGSDTGRSLRVSYNYVLTNGTERDQNIYFGVSAADESCALGLKKEQAKELALHILELIGEPAPVNELPEVVRKAIEEAAQTARDVSVSCGEEADELERFLNV